jgi:cell division protein FtsQ
MRRLNPDARPKATGKAGKAKLPKRRARRRVDWQLLWRFRHALAAVLLAAFVGGLWYSGWIGRQAEATLDWAYWQTAEAGLAVDDVLVEGRQRTEAGSILAALQVERGLPILAFDPYAARERLEALPWVERAEVERHLPGYVFVRLTERQPLALWQFDRKLSVIDRNGEVIKDATAQRFADLPLVVGSDAPAHAAALLHLLDSEPDLKRRVTAAVRFGGRRWDLQMEGGIEVRLPEAGADQAWAELARIEREQTVLRNNVIVIDLRLPDRLIVRTNDGKGEST